MGGDNALIAGRVMTSNSTHSRKAEDGSLTEHGESATCNAGAARGPMPIEREGSFAWCLRVSSPHLVLVAVYLSYLAIGGWIFLAIEGGNQADVSEEVERYEALKARIDEAVRNLTQGREVTEGNLTSLWREYTSMVEDPYLEDLTYLRRVDWTFTGSVLFCATSIATIGYGDAVPVTTWGRIVLVIYSFVGIPLTLTFLADIGGLLARVVMLLSDKCRCSRWAKRSPRRLGRPQVGDDTTTDTPSRQNVLSAPSTEFSARQPAEEGRGLADMRLSLGVFQDSADPVRGSQPNSRRSSFDAEAQVVEHQQRASTAPPGANLFVVRTNQAYLQDHASREEEKKTPNGPSEGMAEVAKEQEGADTMQRHVPVLIVLAILGVYTFLGALMIAFVEEWHYGEALYFTFVTLTTIGFGDFVPVKHYMDIPSFIGCLVYTIVGLSVMSMCIALVQAKVVKVVSRVAAKIGF